VPPAGKHDAAAMKKSWDTERLPRNVATEQASPGKT
jgi:hypothetical protein